jgi:hypothetical protein
LGPSLMDETIAAVIAQLDRATRYPPVRTQR